MAGRAVPGDPGVDLGGGRCWRGKSTARRSAAGIPRYKAGRQRRDVTTLACNGRWNV